MKRGDIWTVAGGKDYAGKPRPVVIVQDDSFDATDSITICALTTDETEAPLFRLVVQPTDRNRTSLGLPDNGRQDHDRPEVQGRRTGGQARRRGYPASQSGHAGVSRIGGLAKAQPEGVRIWDHAVGRDAMSWWRVRRRDPRCDRRNGARRTRYGSHFHGALPTIK
jgi:hypothetical protein